MLWLWPACSSTAPTNISRTKPRKSQHVLSFPIRTATSSTAQIKLVQKFAQRFVGLVYLAGSGRARGRRMERSRNDGVQSMLRLRSLGKKKKKKKYQRPPARTSNSNTSLEVVGCLQSTYTKTTMMVFVGYYIVIIMLEKRTDSNGSGAAHTLLHLQFRELLCRWLTTGAPCIRLKFENSDANCVQPLGKLTQKNQSTYRSTWLLRRETTAMKKKKKKYVPRFWIFRI